MLALVIIILVGGGVYFLSAKSAMAPVAMNNGTDTTSTANPNNPLVGNATSTPTPAKPIGKLKVVNFTGILQEVNTGCFSDGECYVIVDGKHVTTAIGWSKVVVGDVLEGDTVSSISNLEKYIGKSVDVYAKDQGDGTYSLYGDQGFFVRFF